MSSASHKIFRQTVPCKLLLLWKELIVRCNIILVIGAFVVLLPVCSETFTKERDNDF